MSVVPAGKVAAANPRDLVKVDPTQGFSFAGASTELDLTLLRVGFLAASLALDVEDLGAFTRSTETLKKAREALASLSPAVVAAYDRYVASAGQRRLDVNALADLFDTAEVGIATGPARGHGYFEAGLWLGLGLVGVTGGYIDPAFPSMAPPLAVMFEEDAQFEGSDRKLAASLRELAKLVAAERVDVAAFRQALAKAFAVTADTPTP